MKSETTAPTMPTGQDWRDQALLLILFGIAAMILILLAILTWHSGACR